MVANKLIDDSFAHVKDVMKAASDELTNIQSSPIGRDKRSKKETSDMMSKMNSLPEEERNAKMDEMISLSGHQGTEFDDCGLCKMIKDNS